MTGQKQRQWPLLCVTMLVTTLVWFLPAARCAAVGGPPRNLIVELKMDAAVSATATHGLFAAAAGATQRAAAASSPAVTAYAAQIKATSINVVTSTLGAAAAGKIRAHYTHVLAGFALPLDGLTAKQLRTLKRHPAVASAAPEAVYSPQTITTQTFLDLATPGGVWAQLGGVDQAGEDIVIGMLDTGIWPESASFSDRADLGLGNSSNSPVAYGPIPASFQGACDAGEQFDPATHCNLKLIGCRSFHNEMFGSAEGLKKEFPNEYASCRDGDIHGTHTGSTAGGNYGIPSPFDQFPGTITGMAPRARIAMYKICFGGAGCGVSAILAAADQAVKDGVSVINYSIGGGTNTLFEDTFWTNVAAAGIFVAASAGNSGPGPSTVENLAPWVTTVAAGRHSRFGNATVTLGNGVVAWGASTNKAGVSGPLVLAEQVALKVNGTFDLSAVSRCLAGTLDPVLAAGKIVVCDGSGKRSHKSFEVHRAGGIGCIVFDRELVNNQVHHVPTVHLPFDNPGRDALRAYASQPGATATLGVATLTNDLTAPAVPDFSSRGPSPLSDGFVLKPDILAPGVDILAAVPPVAENGRLYEIYSGTSMSSPTLAGIAALVRAKHPSWSPMAVKSALMTTAYQTTRTGEAGRPFGGAFDYGAGHVDSPAALNPGLILDSDLSAWNRFLCGSEVPIDLWPSNSICGDCVAAPETCDPGALNTPSVAATVAGIKTFKRTLTSVLTEEATFTSEVAASGDLFVSVTPSSFSLVPGASQVVSITLDFTTNNVPADKYEEGSITWTSSLGTKTRIPVVAKDVVLTAPKSFTLKANPTSLTFSVTPGYSGTLSTIMLGMVPAKIYESPISQSDTQTFPADNPVAAKGIVPIEVKLPAVGNKWSLVRFALFADDVPAATDLDLFIYKDGKMLGSSSGSTAQERVDIENFSAGTYTAWVHGWSVPVDTVTFKLHVFQLTNPGPTSVNVRSSPASNKPAVAVVGSPVAVKLQFSPRVSKGRWLGSLVYGRDPHKTGAGQAGIAQPFTSPTLIAIE